MHSIRSDIPWVSLTIAGTAQAGIAYANNAADRLIELIDKYDIYSEVPSNWYRLEGGKTWLGHTVNLCGTHALDLSADRSLCCQYLTRLLQAIGASILPLERTGCRHGIGGSISRQVNVSTGPICHHWLPIEVSHRFSAVASHSQKENECLEQLDCRLALSGIPQIGNTLQREASVISEDDAVPSC